MYWIFVAIDGVIRNQLDLKKGFSVDAEERVQCWCVNVGKTTCSFALQVSRQVGADVVCNELFIP
jgi:hypothetical protein